MCAQFTLCVHICSPFGLSPFSCSRQLLALIMIKKLADAPIHSRSEQMCTHRVQCVLIPDCDVNIEVCVCVQVLTLFPLPSFLQPPVVSPDWENPPNEDPIWIEARKMVCCRVLQDVAVRCCVSQCVAV